jgi:hypothetical protein
VSALGRLRLGQAIALPITEEAGGRLRMFTLGPRLTPHVRHREKYVDVPVPEPRAFEFGQFGQDGQAPVRVRTLRQFVGAVSGLPAAALAPYLRRGDFSRWIREVFGDHALAAELRSLERRHSAAPGPEAPLEVVGAIRGRYDLQDDDVLRPAAPGPHA